jgi:putative heme-binding domain-containing protein
VRGAGFERLKAGGAAAVPAVKTILADPNPYHRARAIWLLAELGPSGLREVERQLADPDPQIRVAAFRALRKVKPSVLPEARRLADDASPAVRREVALALKGLPFDQSRSTLLKLAAGYDGDDRWYLEALGTAASGHETALYRALLSSLPTPDPLTWDPRIAAIAWRLHPVASIDAFAARAGSSALPPGARQQALVALAFINDRRAAQAVADLTLSPQRDVAAQAAWWMTFRKTNDWYRYAVTGWTAGTPEATPATGSTLPAHQMLVQDEAAPIDRRIEAALAMAADPAGAQILIQLAAQNKIAYQLREAIGAVIFSNPDRTVRSAAAGFFARPGGRPRMTVDDVGGRTGDPIRGESRFLATCATCHRTATAPVGAEVGPDLTDIGTKFDRRGLIEAIVSPGAAIALGFGGELFVTKRGDPSIGFLQSMGATVSVRDGYGRVRTIAGDDLLARIPLRSSLMPDPLSLGITEQDVADIAAFLAKGR